MKKRKRLWALLLLVPAAYFVWFLEPTKAYTVVREVEAAGERRDVRAVREHFSDRVQTERRGEWHRATPEFLARLMGWNNTRPYTGPPLMYEYHQCVDWKDPFHRYVTVRAVNSMPGVDFIRLRWNGYSWKIDGNWGHGCLILEEESDWMRSLIRVG